MYSIVLVDFFMCFGHSELVFYGGGESVVPVGSPVYGRLTINMQSIFDAA